MTKNVTNDQEDADNFGTVKIQIELLWSWSGICIQNGDP